MSSGQRRFNVVLVASAAITCVMSTTVAKADAVQDELSRMATVLGASLEKNDVKAVAVLDFTDLQGAPTELGRYFAAKMLIGLTQGSKVKVVDHASIQVLIDDHKNLEASGLLNPKFAKERREVAEIAGVDAFVIGTVTPLDRVELSVRAVGAVTAYVVGTVEGSVPKTETLEILQGHGLATAERPSGGTDREVTEAAAGLPKLLVFAIDDSDSPWTREIFHQELENVVIQSEGVVAMQRSELPQSVQDHIAKAKSLSDVRSIARAAGARYFLVGRCVSLGEDCVLAGIACRLKGTLQIQLVDLKTGVAVDQKGFEMSENAENLSLGKSNGQAFKVMASKAAHEYASRLNQIVANGGQPLARDDGGQGQGWYKSK